MRALAFRIHTSSPSDVAGLAELFDRGDIRPDEVVAVLGKTEGNGGKNDFTRELATSAVSGLMAARLGTTPDEVPKRTLLSFSGGTEGVASPHMVVLGRRPSPEGTASSAIGKRLAIGVGVTRAFNADEIGRRAQIDETARAVRDVAGTLGLASMRDVHLVQAKGAISAATFEEREAARSRGLPMRNDMASSRAATALGIGVAIGEIDPREATDEAVCSRYDLWSGVASVSAKPGLDRTEVLVLGNSPTWRGDLAIEHAVMRDAIDSAAVREVLGKLGITFPERPSPDQIARVVGVFAKSEADPRGTVRGRRHVMLDDDDVGDTRWSRCTVAAVIAGVVGETAVYVSTRAEHMGPLGGGPIAVLARIEASQGGGASSRPPRSRFSTA